MNINGAEILECAHWLTDYLFGDHHDILNKRECDHIDRFTWNNKCDNIRCTTQIENKLNRCNCETKTIEAHKQNDIDHLNDFRFEMNLKKKDSKTITECIDSWNEDLIELKDEVEEIEEKHNRYFNRKERQDK
jgi:hypothetical protein